MNVPTRPVASNNPSDGVSRRLWTADELLRMVHAGILSEDDRIELIGGEIFEMSPKGARHENLRTRLREYWSDRRPRTVSIADETPLRLSPHDEPEPETMFYPSSLQASQVRGDTVMLVVEISDTSLSHDLVTKATKYASYGVREYWVIDCKSLETYVHRVPQGTGYKSVVKIAGTDMLTPTLVPALAVRLADLDIG